MGDWIQVGCIQVSVSAGYNSSDSYMYVHRVDIYIVQMQVNIAHR